MLLPIVHMPGLYDSVPKDSDEARRYYGPLVTLLQEAEANCVLCVDAEDIMSGAITRSLKQWPQAQRKRAQEPLKLLKQNNRLVSVNLGGLAEQACTCSGCRQALVVVAQAHPEVVIGFDECLYCLSLETSGTKLIDRDNYSSSTFCAFRRKQERIELRDGQWNKEEFERKIWHPLFRYGKHCRLFDRNIGRTIIDHEKRTGEVRVQDNYAQGIEWIFKQFVTRTTGRSSRVFEVTTGLWAGKEERPREPVPAAAAVLRRFAAELSAKYDFPLTMNVKLERPGAGMDHARYLFTDQLKLMVDRGFDLLRKNEYVRDVVITHCSDPGNMAAAVRRLDDAP